MHRPAVETDESVASPDNREHLSQRRLWGDYPESSSVVLVLANLDELGNIVAAAD